MTSPAAKQLACVLVVALGLRLAAGWWWQSRLDGPFGFGDSESYWVLGRAIAEGKPYEYGAGVRVFRSPGYPLLLAPIFLLGGEEPSVMWARALSAVFGTLSVGGVWWLGRQLFGAQAGLLAAAVAAVYPGAIAISALVLSEAPFGVLMLANLILWIAAFGAQRVGRGALLSVAAGLAAGAATLVRPSWLLFAPFALGVGLAAGRPRRRHLAIGLGVMVGLIAAMTPWWIRDARVTGRFVPTTLQVGASLYDGLNPHATGASRMMTLEFAEAERRDPAGAGGKPSDTFEYRLDRRLRAEALGWAHANPGRASRLALVKLVRMWNCWPNEPTLSSWPIRLAVLVSYVPVLALGILGACRTIRRGWPYVLCWLPAVYFTLLHVTFVGSIRYRQPAMLALIVLAAGVIVPGGGRRSGDR